MSATPTRFGTPFTVSEREIAVPSAGHVNRPNLPVRAGIGLKPSHFSAITESKPDVGFFEVHAENYLVDGGPFHHFLERIRADYSLSVHGVGLSIGGVSSPDPQHLRSLRLLLDRYQPAAFSEHLAWTGQHGIFVNDLLPLPYTQETLQRVCEHIDRVQNALCRQILIENPATYVEFDQSDLGEAEFIREAVQLSGCGLLLDVNNVYVSCSNHGRNPFAFLDALPLHTVGEIHLAGFSRERDSSGAPLLIDSHGSLVDKAVWDLFQETIERTGPRPTLIEWDNNVPPLATLLAEASHAEQLLGLTSEVSHES